MENRRLKAVAPLPEPAEEEEEEDGDEEERLELGLSLGGRLWAGGGERRATAEGGGAGPRRDWGLPWELSMGSSRFFEGCAPLGPAAWAEEAGQADSQSKRAKVAAYNDGDSRVLYQEFHYDGASTLGAELAAPLAMTDYIVSQCSTVPSDKEMVLYLGPVSNDDDSGRCGISNNEGSDDWCSPNVDNSEDVGIQMDLRPTAGNIEDTEIRMDLTDDLLHLVFSFLGQKDLCKAAATCKQWRAASMHEDFWRCLNFENTEISGWNFGSICHRYPNATEVNLCGVHDSDVLVMDAMRHLGRLQTLILGKGQLGDSFFHALTDCPVLNSLRISDANLGNGMQEISLYHDKLRHLHILKCRVVRVSIRCPQLQTLSLKRTSMQHALLNTPQLHELDLSSCHKLSDAGIRSAVTLCPLLEALDVSSCSGVSDETLREIAFACPNLSVLDASYCSNISLESVRLPMLMDLKLQNCEGITSASMAAISYSHLLKALDLDNCGLLTSVSLDLPHLQNISLVHCRKFVDLSLRSPVLSYIKVSNCSALHRINIMSNALKKLILQKQESLATLSLQCYQLQEVDLSDCESLTNSICEIFSDGGGCPMLKTLVLDNCESLSVLGLNSSSLVRLSLTGCRGMVVLELSCPNLQEVNLDGCDHLERASFCPVGLGSLNLGICPKLSILQIEAPKMSSLELKGCGVLSRATINCPCLTSLDASFCRQFMDDSLSATAASCPRINTLILSSCLSVGLDGLSSLHRLQYLTLLDLSYTFLTNLQPVFETCPQLEILKLSACKYLTNSSLDALYKEGALPALRELDLSYSSIGQSAISELLACCTNLVNLNLNGCANMLDLVWGSSDSDLSEMLINKCSSKLTSLENGSKSCGEPERRLEVLNCTGCPNIHKVWIPLTARCFRLSKLNLNLSINLKEVDLACSNLNSLNLSNCSALEILKLDCPRLTNLQLLACSMLEEEALEAAISRCIMLETLNIHSCPKINAGHLERLRRACPSLKRIQSSVWA